ncbi:shieldin complex subunit 2 [Mobula hypostoma]|uniref:shieldin complex subunit 2 n=1 Tax=Mobula hypostoma TaxID=723540 RepID=UPI002FC2C700
MSNKNKIHIFLGAPAIPTQQKPPAAEAVIEGSSKKWLQCHFLYDAGSHTTKNRTTETSQKTFECHNVVVQLENYARQFSSSKCEEGIVTAFQECSGESLDSSRLEQRQSARLSHEHLSTRKKGEQRELSNKRLLCFEGHLKTDEEHVNESTNVLCTEDDFKTREFDNRRTQSKKTETESQNTNSATLQNRLLKEDDHELPHELLMEYLQDTFPNEEQKCYFKCTTVNQSLSTDSEFLSVLAASQAAVLLQKCSESQFNLKTKLKTDATDAEMPSQLMTSTLWPVRPSGQCESEMVGRRADNAESTLELFNTLSNQQLSANGVLGGRTLEGSELLFTSITDRSEGEDEINIEPYSGGILCSQVVNSTRWSFKKIVEISKGPDELNKGIQKPRSPDCLDKDRPSPNRMKTKEKARSPDCLDKDRPSPNRMKTKEKARSPDCLDKDRPSPKRMKAKEKPRSPDCLDTDQLSPKRMKSIEDRRTSHLGHYLQAMRVQWPTLTLGLVETEQLKCCTDRNKKYHILVTVLFCCLLKEIEIKSGSLAGRRVPIATIVVTDQSGITIKVVLWRAAAFWALATFPGDVVLLTDVTVYWDHWQGEEMLQSTKGSKLINLGPCLQIQAVQWSHTVNAVSLKGLIAYISHHHAHLLTLGPTNHQHSDSMQYVSLCDLRPGLVVHALLKVKLMTVLTENMYTYNGKKQQKIVLTVEQLKDKPGTLTLWGNAISWQSLIQKKLDHVWDFRILLVCQNPITGDLELHTTPWSSCECLFDDDERAIEFRSKYQPSKMACVKVKDISTLLCTRHSATFELRTHIIAMKWSTFSSLDPLFTMDAFTSVETTLASLSHLTYSGCKSCGSELEFDENGIYQQCIPCLPNNALKIYYRPTVLTLADGNSTIDVFVSSKLMEKIFLNIPPTCLQKPIGPFGKVTYGFVIADLCCSLFTYPGDCYVLTVQSQLQLDENSIAMKQDFYLLDFHPDL